jgi:hypothetical protein
MQLQVDYAIEKKTGKNSKDKEKKEEKKEERKKAGQKNKQKCEYFNLMICRLHT